MGCGWAFRASQRRRFRVSWDRHETEPQVQSLCVGLLISGAGRLRASAAEEPEPPIVDPGPPGGAPSDAIVLFDGKDLSAWQDARGGPARWEVRDGMLIVNGTGNIFTKQEFGACQLHLEWCAPPPEGKTGQARGNSGVYLQGRYEIQILDSYQNRTYPKGQAGALYGNFPPLVNACRKPGEWQTYDIVFQPPLPGPNGEIIPGFITVIHNGVLVQNHVPVKNATTAAAFRGPVAKGPLMLQDHGCSVRFRNIWIRRLD